MGASGWVCLVKDKVGKLGWSQIVKVFGYQTEEFDLLYICSEKPVKALSQGIHDESLERKQQHHFITVECLLIYNCCYHYMLYILILFYLLLIIVLKSSYVYGGSMWKLSVPSAQSGYEPKIL